MRGDRRLVCLAMAYLVVVPLSAVVSTMALDGSFGLRHILIIPLFALTYSGVSLLGLWAVFSPAAAWRRLVGAAIGTGSLEAAFGSALWPEFRFMPALAMALTVASLLVVRGFGVLLSRWEGAIDHSPRPGPWEFRFSIRGLMLLTAVVAMLGALARAVQRSPGRPDFTLTVTWSAGFVAVGLVALRTLAARDRPIRRGLPAVALSPVLGAFVAYSAEAHQAGWITVIAIMLLDPALLLGALLVVRACGFRLARRTSRSVEVAPASLEPAGSARQAGR
jgi:hypothetical protein